ncbi:MAG TPA: ABC transporter substrate-binding protein [Chthonomonadaceae bacterium]|nr:ABC transporter substrate-binding protein [Chthonomonadaceae bacterium]
MELIRHNRRLRWGVGLLLCGLLLGAHGCRRAEADGPGVVHLSLWTGWSGQEEKNFERVLRRYEQLHPNIRIRNLGAVSDDTKTIRALVAGVPPDFFQIWDPSYLGPLARNHAIRPMDALFRASGLRESDFVPASLRLCKYQGHLYGMPFLIDDTALLWDKGAFKEAGLDPDRPPRTLEELADYALKLTKRDANGQIVRLGLRPLTDPYMLIALFGGKLVDPVTGRITADDPANVAALTWYKNLVDRLGGIEQVNAFASGFGRDQTASSPFFVGKVAMMFNGEWNPYWISRYVPGMKYGVAPVPPPASRPDRARSTWLGGNVFCIPVESKHPKEAWDFLVWVQSREAQVMFAHDMNNVPNTREVLKARELRTGPPFRYKYAIFLDLADSPNAEAFPALPVTNLYMSQMANAMDRILYRDKTPAQALADVRQRVQKELDEQ